MSVLLDRLLKRTRLIRDRYGRVVFVVWEGRTFPYPAPGRSVAYALDHPSETIDGCDPCPHGAPTWQQVWTEAAWEAEADLVFDMEDQ